MFWSKLDEVVESVPMERLVIGADLMWVMGTEMVERC